MSKDASRSNNDNSLSGAQMLIQALLLENVDTIFGYPGGAVLPIYDVLYDSNEIRHILMRHEQAVVHAADGYARVTGRTGVALVTSGLVNECYYGYRNSLYGFGSHGYYYWASTN